MYEPAQKLCRTTTGDVRMPGPYGGAPVLQRAIGLGARSAAPGGRHTLVTRVLVRHLARYGTLAPHGDPEG